MKETAQLANRLEEVLLHGTWIANTNYQMLLEGVSWVQANKSFKNSNSIAQLVFHVNYYIAGVLQVLRGGPLEIKDQFSFDMAPITSEGEWQELKHTFFENALAFVKEVRQMEDSRLNDIFVKEAYGTYRRNIEGQIEHCYYHMGQVVLLKKGA